MKAKEKGIDPQYTTNPRAAANKDNANGRNAKRPFNAFRDYKNGKIQEDSRRGGNSRNSGPVTVFVEGKEFEVDETSGKLKKPEEITFQSGKIVKFDGASTGEESNPVELKVGMVPSEEADRDFRLTARSAYSVARTHFHPATCVR